MDIFDAYVFLKSKHMIHYNYWNWCVILNSDSDGADHIAADDFGNRVAPAIPSSVPGSGGSAGPSVLSPASPVYSSYEG